MTQSPAQGTIELGRLLAEGRGYKVFTHDGVSLGALERVRYEQQISHPDEIVVCCRRLLRRRRRIFPFEAVGEISARERRVVLRADTPQAVNTGHHVADRRVVGIAL